jgi:hypothetical protein
MNDPRKAVQDAIWTLLNGASVTAYVNPPEGVNPPYTVFGDATFIPGPLTTKSSEGAEVTHTCVSWATDPNTAQANASTGLAALTDRDVTWTVTGWEVSDVYPDFGGSILRDDMRPNAVYWGVPYRIRLILQQTA